MPRFDLRLLLAALPLALTACLTATPSATPAPTLAQVTAAATTAVSAPTSTAARTDTALPDPTATLTPEPTIPLTPDAAEVMLDRYAIQEVVSGLERPVVVTHAGDGSLRLFIVEQPGRIRVVRAGTLLEEPYLDLTDRVTDDSNEQGLLGLAFSPTFAEDGRFYVYYTAEDEGKNTIARFTTDPAADVADPDTEQILLEVDDPYGNHNGGMLAFGPDGYLYAGLGDGGSGGDPEDRAQDLGSLLGKIVRLDVSGDALSIPPDNPFASGGGRPEIWIYGLRNPWRFSFDRLTGDLYIGDVGQNEIEEIDYLAAGEAAGRNLGWRIFEGTQPYADTRHAGADPLSPILEYRHGADGCSVTGGYVYRGRDLPALLGVYFYGDYCSGNIWTAWSGDGVTWTNQLFGDSELSLSSLGEDQAGELYFIDHTGIIYKLVAR